MVAYIFGVRNAMHDQAAYERYVEAAVPTLGGTGAQNRAFYGRYRVLEGNDALGAFILEFPTYEAAEAWYDSPEYREAMKLREGAADYQMILIEGAE